MAARKAKRSVHRAQGRAHASRKTSPRNNRGSSEFQPPKPGQLALSEKTLPGRRFIEFPLVQGKIAEKVRLFTSTDGHSLTIEFQDETSLFLSLEPGLNIHAALQHLEKGDLHTLAEWPIHPAAAEVL